MGKTTAKNTQGGSLTEERFLRSINITLDANDADRIAHFFPTAKSSTLIEQLLGETDGREFLVSAPYGSGKSLASTFALQLVENNRKGRKSLKQIIERFSEVDPDLSDKYFYRLEDTAQRGLAIALQGKIDSLPFALAQGALASLSRLNRTKNAPALSEITEDTTLEEALVTIKDCATKAKLDRVVIYWDEFGRHLEHLVSDGLTGQLHDVQSLAEYVSRQKKIPWVLGVFLHQGFMVYGKKLPMGAKKEWKKIEGRFQTIDYIEDSKEIFRLLGEIVSSQSPKIKQPTASKIKNVVQNLQRQEQWKDFTPKDLADLFKKAWPLNPISLELLPKISGRISQNERTLFTFLFKQPYQEEITASIVYDFFSDQMRADNDAGGTFKQWLETESALAKCQTHEEELVIKTCCLMGLGSSGQRNRVRYEQLAHAVTSYGDLGEAETLIESLIKRKLLLRRNHSDEVSIWHGTDMDLRSRLEDEKQRIEQSFNLNDFLNRECLPPTWVPQQYNDKFSIRRYYETSYIRLEDLIDHQRLIRPEVRELAPDCDGKIYYILAENGEEILSAQKALEYHYKLEERDERVVFVLPSEPLQIREASAEISALLHMERDTSLTEVDPLVLPEIKQMLEDSRNHLNLLIEKLVTPSPTGAKWYYLGHAFEIHSPRQLESFLSAITEKNYPLTPIIKNELIVKKKLTSTLVNSRKKFLLALLERCGTTNLGITGNFPDAAIMRTVLLNTGVYCNVKGAHWGFVRPLSLKDQGMSQVWAHIEAFFRDPCEAGKRPQDLFDTLLAPPYGVRPALLPILFAAGLKAFAVSTSLLKDNEYVADVLPTEIETLCKLPERYKVKVLALGEDTLAYLEWLRHLLCQQEHFGDESDLLRKTYEALQAWLRQQPEAVLETRRLTKTTRDFRNALQRNADPVFLLLTRIPEIFGDMDSHEAKAKLEEAKAEIENVVPNYCVTAASYLRKALQVSDADPRSTAEAARDWAQSFAPLLPKNHPERVMLMRMQMGYETDNALLEALSDLNHLSRSSISRWADTDVDHFGNVIAESIRSVEDYAFGKDLKQLDTSSTGSQGMVDLIQSRIQDAYCKLEEVAGTKIAEDFILSLRNTKVM